MALLTEVDVSNDATAERTFVAEAEMTPEEAPEMAFDEAPVVAAAELELEVEAPRLTPLSISALI